MTMHLPILRRTERPHPRHRAADKVRELEHQLAGAEHLINGLRTDRDHYRDLYDGLLPKAARVDDAEQRATAAERQRDEEHAELVELRARIANLDPYQRLAIGERDIVTGDAPTEPIDVRAWRTQYATRPADAITVMPLRFTPFATAPLAATVPEPDDRPTLRLQFDAGAQKVTVSGGHRRTA